MPMPGETAPDGYQFWMIGRRRMGLLVHREDGPAMVYFDTRPIDLPHPGGYSLCWTLQGRHYLKVMYNWARMEFEVWHA